MGQPRTLQPIWAQKEAKPRQPFSTDLRALAEARMEAANACLSRSAKSPFLMRDSLSNGKGKAAPCSSHDPGLRPA